MSLGLQEGVGEPPKHSPPTSAAPAQATHSHPHCFYLSSPSHPHLHSISTCLPSALSFAHLGLRNSQSSKICCVCTPMSQPVFLRTLSLLPCAQPRKGVCIRAASCFLVHTFSHTFLLAQFPLVIGDISVVSVFSLLFLFLFSPFTRENSFHIISSSLLPSAAPGLPSGQPCAL